MPEVHIRPLRLEDAGISYKWRNDPEIWELTGSRPDRTITLQDEQDWINKVMADKSCRRFAIIVDDTYVGNAYLTNIHDSAAEYHIFIGDKNYWGKGVASAASREVIDFGSSELHLKSIYLKVHENNGAAAHVYTKMGFLPTGKEGKFIVMSLKMEDNNE